MKGRLRLTKVEMKHWGLSDAAKRAEDLCVKYPQRYTEVQSVLKTQTYHKGANDERTAILKKVRIEKKGAWEIGGIRALADLEKWLLSRNERYRKNPGGL